MRLYTCQIILNIKLLSSNFQQITTKEKEAIFYLCNIVYSNDNKSKVD